MEQSVIKTLFSVRDTRIDTPKALASLYQAGAPVGAASRLLGELGIPPESILPGAKRLSKAPEMRLSPEESERVVRVLVVANTAREILSDADGSASRWLSRKADYLDFGPPLSPIEIACSSRAGAEFILDLLAQVTYGFPA